MNLSDPIAALEIGTANTVIAIADRIGGGRIKIAAVESIPSIGVRKSQITDLSQAVHSVSAVQKKLEKEHGFTLGNCFLAVTGTHVKAITRNNQLPITEKVVREEDINEIRDRAADAGLDPNEWILLADEVLWYTLDNVDHISSPKGMSGKLLELETFYVHGSRRRVEDAQNAADAARLEVQEIHYAGLCAADAVLSRQDRQDGVLLVDLGGGTTSLVAYVEEKLVYAEVIGVGGDHVTDDIKTAFSITDKLAEEIKKSSASAIIETNDISTRVAIPASSVGSKESTISRRALNTVVNARMQELFEIIRERLEENDLLHRIGGGVVFTGGGSDLRNIIPLAQSVLGCNARIGRLIPEIEGLEKEENPAKYATIAGLLYKAQANNQSRSFMDSIKSFFGGGSSK